MTGDLPGAHRASGRAPRRPRRRLGALRREGGWDATASGTSRHEVVSVPLPIASSEETRAFPHGDRPASRKHARSLTADPSRRAVTRAFWWSPPHHQTEITGDRRVRPNASAKRPPRITRATRDAPHARAHEDRHAASARSGRREPTRPDDMGGGDTSLNARVELFVPLEHEVVSQRTIPADPICDRQSLR